MQNKLDEYEDKLDEYEDLVLEMTHSHASAVDTLDKQLLSKDATLAEMAPAPLQIRKQWMKNIDKKGGCMTWIC